MYKQLRDSLLLLCMIINLKYWFWIVFIVFIGDMVLKLFCACCVCDSTQPSRERAASLKKCVSTRFS